MNVSLLTAAGKSCSNPLSRISSFFTRQIERRLNANPLCSNPLSRISSFFTRFCRYSFYLFRSFSSNPLSRISSFFTRTYGIRLHCTAEKVPIPFRGFPPFLLEKSGGKCGCAPNQVPIPFRGFPPFLLALKGRRNYDGISSNPLSRISSFFTCGGKVVMKKLWEWFQSPFEDFLLFYQRQLSLHRCEHDVLVPIPFRGFPPFLQDNERFIINCGGKVVFQSPFEDFLLFYRRVCNQTCK